MFEKAKRESSMILARKQQGLSLVEFMVAIIVGSLLILGVVEIFVGNKQIYRSVDALSRIQENGRFAIEILGHDLRMTGFAGCAGIASVTPRIIASPAPTGSGLASGRAVVGYEGTAGGAIDMDGNGSTGDTGDISVRPDTDVLAMSSAGSCSAQLASGLTSRTANISVTSAQDCNWKSGDLLMITDCQAMDIFRASADASGSPITIPHANTKNTEARLSKAYEDNAVVFSYTDIIYSVEDDNGEPTLYQTVNGKKAPLISGVEGMQIRYGIDNNGDSSADVYRNATAIGGPTSNNWASVISIEINLLLRTEGTNGDRLVPEKQTYTFLKDTGNTTVSQSYTATDSRIRRVVSKIITLRNQTL